MIVLVIIGLLMAIALPNYVRGRSTARRNICISNQKIIYTAAAMYMNKETDSLEDMGHKERLDALIDRGYVRGQKWMECPSSDVKNYDDYSMAFESGFIEDIDCDEKPTEHVWP